MNFQQILEEVRRIGKSVTFIIITFFCHLRILTQNCSKKQILSLTVKTLHSLKPNVFKKHWIFLETPVAEIGSIMHYSLLKSA